MSFFLVPQSFLPYGNGDIVNPVSDDGSSEAITLHQHFKYFGRIYNQIFVIITFYTFYMYSTLPVKIHSLYHFCTAHQNHGIIQLLL